MYCLIFSVPQVEIRGAPDIYVMAGSGVALHCVISGLIDTPPYIFWYHKTERIAGSALDESRIFDVGSKEATPPVMPGIDLFSFSLKMVAQSLRSKTGKKKGKTSWWLEFLNSRRLNSIQIAMQLELQKTAGAPA